MWKVPIVVPWPLLRIEIFASMVEFQEPDEETRMPGLYISCCSGIKLSFMSDTVTGHPFIFLMQCRHCQISSCLVMYCKKNRYSMFDANLDA